MTQTTPDKQDYSPNQFNDDDLDNLALFSGVVQGAADDRDEQARRDAERESRAPVAYIDEGSYWLRLYPEIRPEADGTRKMHIVRKFWSYTGLAKGVRRLPAPRDPECPVRKEVQRLKDAKYGDAWKFQASEEGLIKACVYKSSLPKDHKYFGAEKLNKPTYLVLRKKQLTALNEFLADLSPEDLRKILNPRGSAPMIKMTFSKGASGSASFGFDIHEAVLPDLPAEFPSIFKVLIDEDKMEPATDEELMKIRKSISGILAANSNVINPDDESGAPPTQSETQRQQAAKAGVADILGKGKDKGVVGAGSPPPAKEEKPAEQPAATPAPAAAAPSESKAEPDPVCPSTDAALEFGAHNPDHMDCITCPFEDKCAKASALPH